MKSYLLYALAIIMLLSLCACGKGDALPKETTLGQTATDTTAPDTSESEEITTEPPETTTEEYIPLYVDGEYTYKIDIRPYLSYICPTNKTEYLIIANRKHPLGSSYVPNNLVSISQTNTIKLQNTAKMALEAMCLEMQAMSLLDTHAQSAYRSYDYQKNLYNKYIERERQKYPHLSSDELMIIVDTYSARAGSSDHQTGLTVDFYPINSSFVNYKAFSYLKDNAYKFGFILRYPEGKTNITGYKYEPWHWRFVGRDAATYIYEHGITLEEYMAEINGTEIEYFVPVEMPPLTPPETTTEEVTTTVPETTTEEITTTVPETTTEDVTTTAEETTVSETTE